VGIEIVEVDVPWHEIAGSKLNTSKLALAVVSLTMLRDMVCVRFCYSVGLWKIKKVSEKEWKS
jgi:dolichyl-phosphate beta-glucosyltransferase